MSDDGANLCGGVNGQLISGRKWLGTDFGSSSQLGTQGEQYRTAKEKETPIT